MGALTTYARWHPVGGAFQVFTSRHYELLHGIAFQYNYLAMGPKEPDEDQRSLQPVVRMVWSKNLFGRAMHASTGLGCKPEESPFTTVFIDVTHRCNMACHNCYIPNRDIPDMDAAWMESILKRLKNRTRIRLVGAEPTMRRDLPALIKIVRSTGHLPVLLTNGLALAKRSYVAKLKMAGLRTLHLSMNGGLRDDLYEALDNAACADRKRAALENLCAENMFVTVGMNLAPGINDHHLGEFWRFLNERPQVREVHFRSIGPMGRYMAGKPFTLDDLIDLCKSHTPITQKQIDAGVREEHALDLFVGRVKLTLTQWPDLGSKVRGRLTPEGLIEPFFEHVILNAAQGGY
jgi:uncharacterized Fe-S cluster-containing radical SAM superfamily protein